MSRWTDRIDDTYRRTIFNLVRRSVQRELVRQREIHHANPNSAENWAQQMFTDPPLPALAEFHHARYAADLCQDGAPGREYPPVSAPWWKWQSRPGGWQRKNLRTNELFGPFVPDNRCDDAPRRETCAMSLSPLQMLILYSLLARPQAALPESTAGTTHDATRELLRSEMIERTDAAPSGYKLSSRAVVFLRAINALPLPIREPAPWVIPKPEAQPQTQFGSREQ